MSSYILKFILCSGILFLCYKLIFEKEKMHHFKRFFLLASIIFSFLIPQIEIPTKAISEAFPGEAHFYNAEQVFETYDTISPEINEAESGNSFLWLLLFYGSISGVLVIRFLSNLIAPALLSKNAEKLYLGGRTLILCDKEISPFCFLNWIFVNKTAYQTDKIEPEILTHEYAHADQKHSVDVIFIELLITFFWFNPFLFLYKKAIRLNHEFLADDAVLRKYGNMVSYQHLMLNKLSPDANYVLSHSFNFLTIKKRLIMMTVRTSTFNRLTKQMMVLPILLAIILVFGEKTFAQLEEEWIKPAILKTQAPKQDIVEEFEKLLKEFQEKEPDEMLGNRRKFSKEENRQIQALENMYKKMDEAQKEQYSEYFFKVSFDRKVPSLEQFESFKDEKMYGIWLDGVRIKNSDLDNYTNKDIYRFGVSRLTKTAKNYGIHVYQANLSTVVRYEEKKKNGTLINYFLNLKKVLKPTP